MRPKRILTVKFDDVEKVKQLFESLMKDNTEKRDVFVKFEAVESEAEAEQRRFDQIFDEEYD